MQNRCVLASVVPLLCATALAQSPIPATAPRAHWVLTPGVAGTPTQRRDNPGAASEDRLYLFGGRDANAGSSVHNALYAFDGATWTLMTADNDPSAPPARGGAAVAWDWGRSKLMVFGGDTGGSAPALLGDTWEWDPTTNAWTDVTPAAPGPGARRWPAMAYDPATGGMLLFGGDTSLSPSVVNNDTWLFIGGVWAQLSPSNIPPARRQHHLMTRRGFGDVFLCSGIDSSQSPQVPFLDTWKWSGFDWVSIAATTAVIPASANANQAVYDEARKRVVMQGGQGIGTVNSALYPTYLGSPTSWCSEFDCITNEWLLYGQPAFSTADPVIGRVSRYFAGYVPALGKVYKVSGQNPSGTGTTTGTCEYQATPLAAATPLGTGCTGGGGLVTLAGQAPLDRPWLGRNFTYAVTNLAPTSLVLGVFGFTAGTLPINALLPQGLPGCNLEVGLHVTFPMTNSGGTATGGIAIPTNTGLVGALFYQQALQVEVAGQSFTISSSNGLELAFGML